jgi:peptidoglycan/xylan/chitin deacetylase (PgdA/CDA1 family)
MESICMIARSCFNTACSVLACIAALAWLVAVPARASAPCDKPVYLTLDTGGMQSAELIAGILNKHAVKATFFIASEKTFRGDHVLDDSWKSYWASRAAEGHAFGSHTWRHGRILGSESGLIRYRPQFGEEAGKLLRLTEQAFCHELRRVDERFFALTARKLDPIWRAPGGHTTPQSLQAAKACGYEHVHWSAAGFLGDELPSDRYPNQMLLDKALRDIRAGDVLMAHLGIWSRKEPYAPMLDPLITQLKSRGFCFLTLAAPHPAFKVPR